MQIYACPQLTVLAFASLQSEALDAYLSSLSDTDIGSLCTGFGLAMTRSDIQVKLSSVLGSLAAAAGILSLLTLFALSASLAVSWALHHDAHSKAGRAGARVGVLPVFEPFTVDAARFEHYAREASSSVRSTLNFDSC